MARDAVVCHPDREELLQDWPVELPDEFFEVTVDDVRRRLAQLKSERWVCPQPLGCPPASTPDPWHPHPRQHCGVRARWAPVRLPLWLGSPRTFTHPLHRKRLEEAPLVTKAFREAQLKEKLERYPKVPEGQRPCGDRGGQATAHARPLSAKSRSAWL